MKSELISKNGEKTYVIIFDVDDEVNKGLLEVAKKENLKASSFKTIGAFQRATFGYFDLKEKEYEKIRLTNR